jgi:hypothetical protein
VVSLPKFQTGAIGKNGEYCTNRQFLIRERKGLFTKLPKCGIMHKSYGGCSAIFQTEKGRPFSVPVVTGTE